MTPDASRKCRQVARNKRCWMIQLQPPRVLSNKTTSLTSALIGRIEEVIDIRFQLPWNFGGYLRQIPRRLGTSAALDTASDALVASHRDLCMGRRLEPNAEVLDKQTRALAVLRNDLGDDVKARSSETLCAIMVLMITQVCLVHKSFRQKKSLTSASSL